MGISCQSPNLVARRRAGVPLLQILAIDTGGRKAPSSSILLTPTTVAASGGAGPRTVRDPNSISRVPIVSRQRSAHLMVTGRSLLLAEKEIDATQIRVIPLLPIPNRRKMHTWAPRNGDKISASWLISNCLPRKWKNERRRRKPYMFGVMAYLPAWRVVYPC